jgi:hypothetical protein
MGEDRDIVVLGFRVREKYPAKDLMEFLERGYKFILDADMSTGEENDGQYQVFVEMERTEELPKQLAELLNGITQLTSIKEWRYRYQRSPHSVTYDETTVNEHIPLTPEKYEQKILEYKTQDVGEVFDQGITEYSLDENDNLTFSKPYSGKLSMKLNQVGDYEALKDQLPGGIQLDESSRSQVTYLEKYLGPYEIHKINNKFLVRNQDKAAIISFNKG